MHIQTVCKYPPTVDVYTHHNGDTGMLRHNLAFVSSYTNVLFMLPFNYQQRYTMLLKLCREKHINLKYITRISACNYKNSLTRVTGGIRPEKAGEETHPVRPTLVPQSDRLPQRQMQHCTGHDEARRPRPSKSYVALRPVHTSD